MMHSSISGVTADSRQVKPGHAFVAIPGREEDGHRYIKEAVDAGAQLILGEKIIPHLSVPQIKVANARKALACTAAHLFHYPGKKLQTIGITGTNGKTTTAFLLHHLLAGKGGLISTIGSWTGKENHPAGLTTPDAVTIQSLLALMVKNQLPYAVIEVSSHGIHQHRVDQVDFQLLIHTSISIDHLDYHQTFSQYLATKRSLFLDHPTGLALFNRDDPYFSILSRGCKNPSYTYGIREKALIQATGIKEKELSSSFTICLEKKNGRKENYWVQLPLPGRHNIYNALAAFGGGLLLGLKPVSMIKRLQSFPGVWRRMQVQKRNGFTLIDDCAHNPGSYQALFTALQGLSYRKLFIMHAIRGNRGREINRENARVIGKSSAKIPSSLHITRAQDLTAESDWVTKEEEEIFRKTLAEYPKECSFTPTFGEALQEVLAEAKEGDAILLAGAHAFDRARDGVQEEGRKFASPL